MKTIALVLMTTLVLLAGSTLAQQQPEMKMPPASSGFLGAIFAVIDEDRQAELGLDSTDGMLIIEVVPDSPAAQAGLTLNDVVRRIDDEEVPDRDTFIEKMSTTKPGQTITILIIRAQQEQVVDVTLGTRPAGFGTTQPTTRPARLGWPWPWR